MSKKITDPLKVYSETKDEEQKKYVLRLYVAGILPNSARAVINIKTICEKYLNDRCELEIIDIYQQPELALSEQIVAIPLLVKKSPYPQERMIGDLSDLKKYSKYLDSSK